MVSGTSYDVSGESSANSTAAQGTGDVANRQRLWLPLQEQRPATDRPDRLSAATWEEQRSWHADRRAQNLSRGAARARM